MRSPPSRPSDDERGADAALREAGGDAADLLDRPSDERRSPRLARAGVCSAAAFARWRATASTANAGIARETWRCQPRQERVSSWSRPSSFLAVSNASSIARRLPSTETKASIGVPAGHQVLKNAHPPPGRPRRTGRGRGPAAGTPARPVGRAQALARPPAPAPGAEARAPAAGEAPPDRQAARPGAGRAVPVLVG